MSSETFDSHSFPKFNQIFQSIKEKIDETERQASEQPRFYQESPLWTYQYHYGTSNSTRIPLHKDNCIKYWHGVTASDI